MQQGQGIDGEAAGDVSGYSVSINAAGDIVAIGAPANDANGSDSGHARVYKFISGSWVQQGQNIDGEAAVDNSGYSVSISAAGDIVAIGAVYGHGDGLYSGRVRIYKYISGSWVQQGQDIYGEADDDLSGCSVSINAAGDIVAIGATGNDANGSNSGHARVYKFIFGSWVQQGQDIDGETGSISGGCSVSINAAGDIVAIGAAYLYGSGHIRVYRFVSGSWVQQGQGIDGEAADDYTETSVSMNAAGDVITIGANGNNGNGSDSGRVRVYTNDLGYIADSYKLSNLNPTASGLLTVFGNVSSSQTIYASGGNSDQWSSAYALTENLVYTTGDQTISGRKIFSNGLDAGLQVGISTLYVGSGLVGVNNEDPQAAFDVSGSVLFSQRPTVNGTGVMLSGDINSLSFYLNNNPSGFITGIQNLVYTTGDQTISGIKTFEQGLEVGSMLDLSTLYILSGAVGINNENPQASLDVSGLALFSQRPIVNTTGVMLSGDIDISNFYPNDNPSGYITGIQNLVYTTGDQTISGIKTFPNDVTILGNFAVSGTTYINEVIDVTTTGIISGVTGVFQHLEADNIVYSQTNSYVVAQPGDDLIVKYAEAAALTPNGSAKSTANRASLIIMPGNYALSAELAVNVEFVDIVGLGAQTQKPAVLIGGNTLNVIANDVRVSGISVGVQVFKTADNKQLQIFENCVGGDDSFGGVIGYVFGTFTNCTGGANSFGGGDQASGTFVNCVGGTGSFGGGGGRASGTFENCVGGDNSFGGGEGIAPGTFTNCTGGNGSFGSEEASGTFVNCVGGDNSFASGGIIYGNATFTNCTGGANSFAGGAGSGSDARGMFIGCTGGSMSFGGSGTASGIFKNCVALDGSFGTQATGSFTDCQSGSHSWAGEGGICSGTFLRCTGGGPRCFNGEASGSFTDCKAGSESFGSYYGSVASGTFTNCTGGNLSFGGNTVVSGTLINCRLTSGDFQVLTAPATGKATMINCIDGNGDIINGEVLAE